MVTFKPIAEQWAQAISQCVKRRTPALADAGLSDRDASTVRAAIDIVNAHDAFLDKLSAEENNRMALEPRDYRVEFTTFYLQRKAINKHREK